MDPNMKTGKLVRKGRGIDRSLVGSTQFIPSFSFVWAVAAGASSVWAQVGAPPPGGIEPPPVTKHEIAVSGDYLHGFGDVTFPFGFALADNNQIADSSRRVTNPERDSDYFGVTVSYSYGQAWYLDLSYAHGDSTGDYKPPSFYGIGSTTFTIDDDSYRKSTPATPFLRCRAHVSLLICEPASAIFPSTLRSTATLVASTNRKMKSRNCSATWVSG